MIRQCERCQYDISISYLLKQEDIEEITCPNCGRQLVVTDLSRVLTVIFFIMFFVLFFILPLKFLARMIIEVIWIEFSKHYLPLFLYMYEEKNEEDY